MTEQLYAVLELPDKGAYAPNKFGCRYGDFIKTEIHGDKNPAWIFGAKFYDLSDQKQRDQFNAICSEIIPHCHQRKMRIIPRIISIKVESTEDLQPEKPKKEKPKKGKMPLELVPSIPKISVPSGGE